MKLNIVTSDAEKTLSILKECFINENVELVGRYPQTADYTIASKTNEEVVFSAESLIELSHDINISSIRIY